MIQEITSGEDDIARSFHLALIIHEQIHHEKYSFCSKRFF